MLAFTMPCNSFQKNVQPVKFTLIYGLALSGVRVDSHINFRTPCVIMTFGCDGAILNDVLKFKN